MVFSEKLIEFGLSEKEAKVYLATLELGEGSVQAIAAQAGIHRVSTYDLLENLRAKGFVFEAQQGKRRIIRPVEPEQVAAAIRSKEQQFSLLVPELTALQGKAAGKPRALYFEGHAEIWQTITSLRDNANDNIDLLIYGSPRRLLEEYKIELKREANGLAAFLSKARNLQENSDPADSNKQNAESFFGQIKKLPDDKKINGNIFIYNDRVLSVSWELLTAIIIEDKYNAENQRCIFNLLWHLLI